MSLSKPPASHTRHQHAIKAPQNILASPYVVCLAVYKYFPSSFSLHSPRVTLHLHPPLACSTNPLHFLSVFHLFFLFLYPLLLLAYSPPQSISPLSRVPLPPLFFFSTSTTTLTTVRSIHRPLLCPPPPPLFCLLPITTTSRTTPIPPLHAPPLRTTTHLPTTTQPRPPPSPPPTTNKGDGNNP